MPTDEYDFSYATHVQGDLSKIKKLRYDNREIYKVGDRPIPYPLDSFDFKPEAFQPVRKSNVPAVQVGDKHLPVWVLHQPIILNFRAPDLKDPQLNAKATRMDAETKILLQNQLKYFKANGKQANFFIHGFNVPFGSYQKQIKAFQLTETTELMGRNGISLAPTVKSEGMLTPSENPQGDLPIPMVRKYNEKADPIYNTSDRTIYSGLSILKKAFPNISDEKLLPWGFCDETCDDDSSVMHGNGTHLWFLHMEDNLNLATNQYDHEKYQHYLRLVNVAWRGDVGVLDYMGSEETANWAGARLANAIDYLLNAMPDLEINIIAHSMGNRVMLTALEALGQSHPGKINHVFSWDASLPDSVLSKTAGSDKSAKQNCYFPHAMDAVKKITVLYSNNDDLVLNWAYQAANVVDEEADKAEVEAKTIFTPRDKMTPLEKAELAATSLSALGREGPDMTDDFVIHMFKNGKLILGDMTKYSKGHSYMKVPSEDIKKHGYKTFIINKTQGLTKFGRYDGSQFSDFTAPGNTTMS